MGSIENGPYAKATFSQVAGGTPPRQATPSKEEIKDQSALHILQNAVRDTISPLVIATPSTEAWDNLQKEFQGSRKINAIRLQILRRDIKNLSMEFKENINDYYIRVTDVINQMKMYGDEIKKMMSSIRLLAP